MKPFLFKDADTLASGEISNILQVNAKTLASARALIRRGFASNVFTKFGRVSLSGATWTESSKTLTLTGGFTRYLLANSTRIIIVSGTGATAGEYAIATRVGNDSITLSTSIGAGADGQTDIVAYIIGGRTVVPIERTVDTLSAATPAPGSKEDGTAYSSSKGVHASAFVNGIIHEVSITAA